MTFKKDVFVSNWTEDGGIYWDAKIILSFFNSALVYFFFSRNFSLALLTSSGSGVAWRAPGVAPTEPRAAADVPAIAPPLNLWP